MKTLILDYKKWRCGSYSNKSNSFHGTGNTRLLNDQGYMCCLGQFACQLNPSLDEESLIDKVYPSSLKIEINSLSQKDTHNFKDTKLSDDAIAINDNDSTTIKEKIAALKKLFKKNNYPIRVINLPNRFKNKK